MGGAGRVRRRDGQGVGATGARGRGAREGGRAIAVVDEVHPRGQRAGGDSAGAGAPLVATLKVPDLAAVKVAVVALVMAGAWVTTSENVWTTDPAAFLAVILRVYVLAVPAAGVPERVAVPLPLSTKVTPLGSVPVEVSAGVG